MSENKHTSGGLNPDEPNGKEPALSELISSTMESMGKKKLSGEQDAAQSVEEKTIVAPKLNIPPRKEPAGQDKTVKTDRSDVPEISFKKNTDKPSGELKPDSRTDQPVKKETAANGGENKKPAQKDPEKPEQHVQKKEPAGKASSEAKRKTEDPAEKKPQPKKSTAAVDGAKKIPPKDRPKKPASSGTSKNAPAKKPAQKPAPSGKTVKNQKTEDAKPANSRFTKKQAATVAGLIASLLLVLALIVVLIFNHYYNKLDTSSINDSVNSAPMTYSDVDLSRADTIDKAAEDEKLKELSMEGEKISNKDVMNILLIGEDLRDTASKDAAGNTDVMMIISVNTKDKTITMTSVMRDCYVSYQDENGYWWSNRINAAYWTGGVKLTQQTIENYMNVKIDRYVLVNFKVFIDIVDTLGGLDIHVTDEEANGYPDADPNGDNTRGMQNPLDEQNKYLGNKKGTDYIKKGGDLHLNGNQALAYARLRHVGNADYERTERQRKVIAEMIKKSRSLSIVEMDKLANKIFPQIKTDVTKAEAAQLLIDMLDYRNYEIQEFRVPADGTYTNQVINGMDVLSVDFNMNAEQFRELVYGSIKLDEEGNEKSKTIE